MILIADKIKAKYLLASSYPRLNFNMDDIHILSKEQSFILGICIKIVYWPNDPMDLKFIKTVRNEYEYRRKLIKLYNLITSK